MSKHALAIMFAISASLAVPAARAAASDYIPLEYIYMEGGAAYGQSAATHFIDTGVVPSGDWTITASFASNNTTAATGTGAFSAGTEVLIPEQSSGLSIFVR